MKRLKGDCKMSRIMLLLISSVLISAIPKNSAPRDNKDYDYDEKVSERVIFITGGDNTETSTEVLDPQDSASPCSRLTASLPDERAGHSLSRLDDGELVLCGGDWSNDTLTSCISTGSPSGPWTHHSQLAAGRGVHASAVTGDNIHLLGGHRSEDTVSTLEDGIWEERDMPYIIHWGACAVAINDTAVIVIGGEDAWTTTSMWNPVTDQWTWLPDMETQRAGHGCGVITERGNMFILVAGGWDHKENILKTSAMFDVGKKTWISTGELNQARVNGVMVNTNKDVFMLGGWNQRNVLNTVERFDVETNKWVATNLTMKKARHHIAVVAVDRETFC